MAADYETIVLDMVEKRENNSTTYRTSDPVMTPSPAQMSLLVPPEAHARQQDHQLRGGHLKDLCLCLCRALLVALDAPAPAPTLGPPPRDQLPPLLPEHPPPCLGGPAQPPWWQVDPPPPQRCHGLRMGGSRPRTHW